jgi:hypothetical protein
MFSGITLINEYFRVTSPEQMEFAISAVRYNESQLYLFLQEVQARECQLGEFLVDST